MRTLFALLTLTLSGCASMIDRPLAARVGLPISAVISDIGTPDQERVVNGQRVFTWTRRLAYQGNMMECTLNYTVDRAGQVVDYDWQGQLGACNF